MYGNSCFYKAVLSPEKSVHSWRKPAPIKLFPKTAAVLPGSGFTCWLGGPVGGGRRAGPGKCLQASAPGKAPADRRRLPVTYLPGQLEPRAGRGRDNHLPEVSFPQKETPSHQSLLFSQPPGLLSPSSYCPPHHRLVKRGQVVGQGRTSLFGKASWPRGRTHAPKNHLAC